MARLLFEKTGNAIWISHLDLMRLFQRAFKRAGLPLTHTQGYNPRPSVSIALPLSVGIESTCELLDFDLDGETKFSCEDIKQRLNASLVAGVQVLEVYEDGRKIRDLALLKCQVQLEYDAGIPDGSLAAIEDLFKSESLTVSKKSKNSPTEQDIIPMIREFSVSADGFLYNMVRIMVGTLLKVEAGKILPCDISKIISAKNRALAGSTAKAHGLYLKKVQYDS